jgi:hypothetical protein
MFAGHFIQGRASGQARRREDPKCRAFDRSAIRQNTGTMRTSATTAGAVRGSGMSAST